MRRFIIETVTSKFSRDKPLEKSPMAFAMGLFMQRVDTKHLSPVSQTQPSLTLPKAGKAKKEEKADQRNSRYHMAPQNTFVCRNSDCVTL
ncbi:MAG TPA: hypothetical protein GX499_02090 [Clostridiales bacterium]|nr:hypothetical protein [Clostridiales bacterium]